MRIIGGAQPFGYGPSSKFTALSNHLSDKGATIDFWGQDVAQSYVRTNLSGKGQIIENQSVCTLDPRLYEAVLTVMEPSIAAWGYFHDIPVVAVDSLYWFWEWSLSREEFSTIEQDITRLKHTASLNALLSYINLLPAHIQQYVTHLMAVRSFIQYYPDLHRDADLESTLRLSNVGPIVDTQYKKFVKRDTILVSFSGLLNPIISRRNAVIYIRLVYEILRISLQELQDLANIVVAVNPLLVTDARNIFPWPVKSLNHDDFLDVVNRSLVVITPVGITTTYECLAYETPIFFLPEQHDGHFPNYKRLASLTTKQEQIRATFPESLVGYRYHIDEFSSPEEYVSKLYILYTELLSQDKKCYTDLLGNSLTEPLSQIIDPGTYTKFRHEQQTATYFLWQHSPNPFREVEKYILSIAM